MKLDNLLKKTIVILFCFLFFLIPLFFTSVNSELFEFNKIILVYGFSTLITGTWFARMIFLRKIIFTKTPFFVPLVLFLISQFSSTLLSIDPHTSIFGYYSRFNGGLLSLIAYCLLFFALVSNCDSKDVFKFIKVTLISAAVTSIYGILEHFGYSFSCLMFTGKFDVSCWIQDVKNRVFATIGQPNWLAAYLSVLIPIILGFLVNLKLEARIKNQVISKNLIILNSLFIILYSCLLFTGSRSGFAGLVVGLVTFWIVTTVTHRNQLKFFIKPFLILNSLFLILTFVFGSPFSQINKYFSFNSLKSHFSPPNPASQLSLPPSNQGPQLEIGGSESGAIRKIVWKGAINVFKHYPLFGSGVETFAYSYYNFRPIEHNLVSEWDFLYNKAHNEYLNYLATTGIVGLGAYLLFIGSFVFWNVKEIARLLACYIAKKQESDLTRYQYNNIAIALFCGWITILISNFFGFSVVVVSLYFFLIPAFAFILNKSQSPPPTLTSRPTSHLSPSSTTFRLLLLPLLFTIYYLLFTIIQYWRADYYYAIAQKLNKQNEYLQAYEFYQKAYTLSPNEPVIISDLSIVSGNISYVLNQQKESTKSAEIKDLEKTYKDVAISYSDLGISKSPKNILLWKARVKLFYILSLIDKTYLQEAIKSIEAAIKLSPTDPKLTLNLGLLLIQNNKINEGLVQIQKAIEMKPNYEEARNDLAILYEQLGNKQKALEQYEYIVNTSKPNDEELKAKIIDLRK